MNELRHVHASCGSVHVVNMAAMNSRMVVNELLHVQVQQQRAASSALEGDVRSLEAYCAQLESRCESYEAERRASRG